MRLPLAEMARSAVRIGTAVLLACAVQLPAWAQCAMCREVAGNQKAGAIVALNRGIILLGIPPLAILIGLGWAVYKYRGAAGQYQVPVSTEKP